MNFLEFKKYSKDLSLLSDEVFSNLHSLAFSNRGGKLSVSAITRDRQTFKKMCSKISLPKHFLLGDFIKWGVHLESIGTDMIRIYRVPPKSNNIRIEGFYIDKNGKVLQRKLYKLRSTDELAIDRYDAAGKLISSNEIEKSCLESDWPGPQELVDEVKLNGYEHNFMKKMSKNQVYLIIHRAFISEV